MEETLRQEIEELVNVHLKKRGALEEGVTYEVLVRRKSALKVTVEVDPTEPSTLTTILEHMPHHLRSRLKYALEKMQIDAIEKIHDVNVEELRKQRNVGKLVILALASSLENHGYPTSSFIKNARQFFGVDKPRTPAEQAQFGKAVAISEDDWKMMRKSILRKRTTYTSYQMRVLNALKKSGNKMVFARDIFPKSLPESWWKTIPALMCQRWDLDSLQYRAKFTRRATSTDRWNGTIQIVVYKP